MIFYISGQMKIYEYKLLTRVTIKTVVLGVRSREAKRATTLSGFQAQSTCHSMDLWVSIKNEIIASLLFTVCPHSVLSYVYCQRFLQNISPIIFVTEYVNRT